MNEQKSLFLEVAEAIDRHLKQRNEPARGLSKPGRVQRLVRWLLPNGGTLILIALLIATQSVWARTLQSPAAPGPSATTVNYQGRLADSGGTPITGSRAMSFAIYDAATSGNLIWGPEAHMAIPVSNGLFSVGLGSQTSGGIPTTAWNGDRYLEITVGGETLSPRELIRSVPIAGMALTVPDGSITTAKIADGNVASDDLNLSSGKQCLSSRVTVSLAGSYQAVNIPALTLNFSLAKPSKVLVWMDGLAAFVDGSVAGEANIALLVDGAGQTGSINVTTNDDWFNVKGQRLLNLASGNHSLYCAS